MSDAIPILHMLSPRKHNSPFDVNMAADAGYKRIVPYVNVAIEELGSLVQDAMFSRPPQDGRRTGIFIGGKDAILALDMLDTTTKAMVAPFQVSVLADPAGSFTTAAAMVACVERVLKFKFGRSLKGMHVAVFGATGVVGFAASVIAALQGASVQLVAHRGVERVVKSAAISKQRFGVELEPASGETDEERRTIIANANVILVAATAGTRVISAEQLNLAQGLLVIADVNAVPPLGVEGLDPFMDGAPLAGCDALGVGPLTIGNIKYKTESGLFKQMIASNEPLALDFRHAFTLARELTA
jgi:methylene-tetrahydromethanopterin dehydrogenase